MAASLGILVIRSSLVDWWSMKKECRHARHSQCICPLSWSVHCNFTGEGKCYERGWACTPHPHQPGLILPSSPNVCQKAAVASLCTPWEPQRRLQKTKVLGVFLLAIHSTPTNGFYAPPPPPLEQTVVCNVNIVYGNLKSENSPVYAQKPQQNCTFMNSASEHVGYTIWYLELWLCMFRLQLISWAAGFWAILT
jgi:hypothetical protein